MTGFVKETEDVGVMRLWTVICAAFAIAASQRVSARTEEYSLDIRPEEHTVLDTHAWKPDPHQKITNVNHVLSPNSCMQP